MPRSKKSKPKSTKSKKTMYKKKNSTTKLNSTVKFGLGLPKKVVVTHRYTNSMDITSTGGVASFRHVSCNGMYAPDPSATSIQPYYFDQFTPLYNHYCVIGSKITIRVCPAVGNTVPGYLALWINDDTSTTAYSTAQSAGANSTAKLMFVPPNLTTKPLVLTEKWSAKKYFGGTVLSNDELQGTVAANPVEQSYFTIIYNSNSAANTTVNVSIQVEYIAIWKELKEPSPS